MASLRQQAKNYDTVFASTAKKAARKGMKASINFKGTGATAAYRGAANKTMRSTGSSLQAARAGYDADQRVKQARKKVETVDKQFANKKSKSAQQEYARQRKEASQGGSM